MKLLIFKLFENAFFMLFVVRLSNFRHFHESLVLLSIVVFGNHLTWIKTEGKFEKCNTLTILGISKPTLKFQIKAAKTEI
jgi:uncharacterized ion transporter superfamily protein YfcC